MPRFAAPDGCALFYDDAGSGPPLLCLSGLTRNATDFDYLMPHLGDRRVIRLDYRGRGRSDWSDPATYTLPTESRDVIALLDHLGLESVPIIGTSRGGLIAMILAATQRARVAGVCLVDIGPVIADAGLQAIMGYVGRNPQQKTYSEAIEARASLMAGFEGVPPSRWEEEVRKHYLESEDGLVINYDPALGDVVRAGGAEPGADLWPLFDAMEGLPLALIRGANSDLLDTDTAQEMRRRRPDMIFAEVPGRGHVPFLDEPESVEAIRAWLTKL